jgi:hypothetical protein
VLSDLLAVTLRRSVVYRLKLTRKPSVLILILRDFPQYFNGKYRLLALPLDSAFVHIATQNQPISSRRTNSHGRTRIRDAPRGTMNRPGR